MKKTSIFIISSLACCLSPAGLAAQVAEVDGTTFNIGGYVKAEGIFTSPDASDNFFDSTARQSRINFSAARKIQEHQVQGFVEGDFWGNNVDKSSTYNWRLRHAYIKVDNLTVGQTWNGQFLATAPFETPVFNFFGSNIGTVAGNGAVVRSDTVLHYQIGPARLSLQDPINSNADYPDLVFNYAKRYPGGHGVSFSLTGRDVATSGDSSEFAAALSVAAKAVLGDTQLTLGAFSGEGQAVYAGYGYNGSKGAATSDINALGQLVQTTGFSAGLSHRFNGQLRSSVRYGQVQVDETAAGVEDTFKMTNINLVYSYLPNLDFGIEWRDQNATNRPATAASGSLRPAGQQIEIMTMYKF